MQWYVFRNEYDRLIGMIPFGMSFFPKRYDEPFRYDYDNLFGSAIRFYRRMLIETDGRTKFGHPERQGKIPHCGVENARNDHQGSSNGGILPCDHLFSMTNDLHIGMTFSIIQWHTFLYRKMMYPSEWIHPDLLQIYIHTPAGVCSNCLVFNTACKNCIGVLSTKQSAEKSSQLTRATTTVLFRNDYDPLIGMTAAFLIW